jgi:hypothetical protein
MVIPRELELELIISMSSAGRAWQVNSHGACDKEVPTHEVVCGPTIFLL